MIAGIDLDRSDSNVPIVPSVSIFFAIAPIGPPDRVRLSHKCFQDRLNIFSDDPNDRESVV